MSTRYARVVEVGSSVRVRDGELVEDWRIVPAGEADPSQRRLSVDSPMARALLGHRSGDRVQVRRPQGDSPITILAVD